MVAKALRADPVAVEGFKTSEDIPVERSAPPRPEHTDFLEKIRDSHLYDHWNYFNEEQREITKQALSGDLPETVETRTVAFGGTTIDQYKFRLQTPVWSRRVWLPVEFEDMAILNRRHTKTPGVDFIVPLTDEVKKFMTKVDTQILTIRRGDPPVPGTGFAGTHFPGSSDKEDFTGILYKWYKTVDEREQDIAHFVEGIRHRIPALIDAVDYQTLVLGE